MRRLLIASLTAALLLAGCGGDDDDTDATATEDASAEASDDASDDASSDADDDESEDASDDASGDDDASFLAQQFIAGLGFDLPTDEAECAAAGVLEEFGTDLDAFESSADIDSEVIERLAPRLDECISRESLEGLLLQTAPAQLTDAQKDCYAAAVADTITIGEMMQLSVDSEAMAEFQAEITPIMTECMAAG